MEPVDKAQDYKALLRQHAEAARKDDDLGRKSMFTEKLLKLLYAM